MGLLSNIPILGIIIRAQDDASRSIDDVGKSITKLAGIGGRGFPIAGVLAGIGTAAAAAGVGVATAAIAMSKGLAESAERLDRLSATTGTSVENLQVLERAFKNAGFAPEVALQDLARL